MLIRVLFIIIGCFSLSAYGAVPFNEPLKLISVNLIDSDYPLEPSGLANCGDKILLISDKFDEVFWLKPGEQNARADVYMHISAPMLPMPKFLRTKDELKQKVREMVTKFTFDWESISCDDAGHVYIGSERNTNILQVDLPSETTPIKTAAGKWILNGFDEYAKSQHFFEVFNAGLESMSWRKGGFILAAERSPRGLFNLDLDDSGWHLKNMAKIPPNGLAPIATSATKPDFSDVYIEANKIYTLERYTGSVCRRAMNNFELEKCWSYREVENDPKWIYRHHRYGVAEGLTVFQNRIYITTDNNLETREAAPKDARPELYQFQLPPDWSE